MSYDGLRNAWEKVHRWAVHSPDEAYLAGGLLVMVLGVFTGGLIGVALGVAGMVAGFQAGRIRERTHVPAKAPAVAQESQ